MPLHTFNIPTPPTKTPADTALLQLQYVYRLITETLKKQKVLNETPECTSSFTLLIVTHSLTYSLTYPRYKII